MTLAERFRHMLHADTPGRHPAQGWTLPRPMRWVLIALGAAAVLVVAILLFLSRSDWDFMRGPVSRFASARAGRPVRIDGHLRAHLLSWTPEVWVGGLSVGKPAWAGSGALAQAGLFDFKVELVPLFWLQVNLPLVSIDQMKLDLLRDAQGRESWVMNSSSAGKPLKLPPIRNFIISNGQVHLIDETRKLTLDGSVNASERPTTAGGQGFSLVGHGSLNREPFLVQATGAPLLDVRRDRPYPFHMDLRAGPNHAVITAQISRPFDLGALDGTLDVSGPDLSRLYDLTGITLPSTGAYHLSSPFQRNQSLYDFSAIKGTIGASDLEGQLKVDRVQGRRTLNADLRSQHLYFPDLLSMLGGPAKGQVGPAPTSTPTVPLPGAPAAVAPKQSGGRRMMPDTPLMTERLRTMDADVRYRAEAIRSGVFGVSKGALTLKLDQGVLTLDPLRLDFPKGRIGGRIRIDARAPTVKTDLDMRVTDFPLQQFLSQPGADPAIQGTMEARAQLHGTGDSVHKTAASANGQVVFVVPHGEMRQAFAELMGINVGRGLYLLLSKDPKRTDLRCAVAQFDVKGGVMQAQTVVVDTGVVTAIGSGTVDLGAERLDLKLKGHTKHPELLRIWSPINITGPLSKPSLGVDAGSVAAQGGLSVLATAVLGPLSTILPFVAPGMAKDADCVSLVDEAKASGAPVKPAQAAAATAARTAATTAPRQH